MQNRIYAGYRIAISFAPYIAAPLLSIADDADGVMGCCGRWTRERLVSSVCAHRGPGCGIQGTSGVCHLSSSGLRPHHVCGEPMTISVQGERAERVYMERVIGGYRGLPAVFGGWGNGHGVCWASGRCHCTTRGTMPEGPHRDPLPHPQTSVASCRTASCWRPLVSTCLSSPRAAFDFRVPKS
jgi:hypothetical protein